MCQYNVSTAVVWIAFPLLTFSGLLILSSLGVVGGNDAKHLKDRSDPWRFFERGNNGKNCEFLLNLQNNVQTTSTTKTPSAWAQTISGELTCINCSFNAVLEVKKNRVDFQTLYPKAVHYCLLATAMCLFQIYFIVKQINYSQTQAAAARISLLCISLQVSEWLKCWREKRARLVTLILTAVCCCCSYTTGCIGCLSLRCPPDYFILAPSFGVIFICCLFKTHIILCF